MNGCLLRVLTTSLGMCLDPNSSYKDTGQTSSGPNYLHKVQDGSPSFWSGSSSQSYWELGFVGLKHHTLKNIPQEDAGTHIVSPGKLRERSLRGVLPRAREGRVGEQGADCTRQAWNAGGATYVQETRVSWMDGGSRLSAAFLTSSLTPSKPFSTQQPQ